jgi:hypothetical protein
MFVVEVSGKSPSKFVSFFRSTQKRNFFAFQLLADGRRLTLREKKSVFFLIFQFCQLKDVVSFFLVFTSFSSQTRWITLVNIKRRLRNLKAINFSPVRHYNTSVWNVRLSRIYSTRFKKLICKKQITKYVSENVLF